MGMPESIETLVCVYNFLEFGLSYWIRGKDGKWMIKSETVN